MKPRPKPLLPTEPATPSPSDPPAVVQVKVWLVGISPMVWRRVLVLSGCTLRELHGVFQVAMGWEGIHLYQFCLRAARYGSWELSASSPDVTLAALQFRKGARFVYEYDLNVPWRHEVRIEDRRQLGAGKTYPTCTGGSGACPPEDCGGPAAFMAGRDGMLSSDAIEDLETIAEIIGQVALDRRPEVLDDDETRWRLESASRSARRATVPKGGHSPGGRSIPVCVVANIATSCTSSADTLSPALRQQVGSEHRRFIALMMPNVGDQRVGRGIGDPIEVAFHVNRHAKGTPYRRPKGTPASWLVPVVP
jgi:hypothetical protein